MGFVLETNGRSSSEFPRHGDDPDEMLRGFFSRMDGERLFAFLLYELPAGQLFGDGRVLNPQEFIQCAGTASALTVEVREREDSGFYLLSTVGRAGDDNGPKDVEITWRGSSTSVHRAEQWTSDEAAELFLTYWRTRSLPDNTSKRPLERL